jgi:DNA-directed RNA polymerase subunit beta
LAASRSASAIAPGPHRISFARIREPLEVPSLLALQTDSFDWLLGNEKWLARIEAEHALGRKDLPEQSGLEEIFEEISPIRVHG